MRFLFIMLLLVLTGCVTGASGGFGQYSPTPSSDEQLDVCHDGIGPGAIGTYLDSTYKMTFSDQWRDYQISPSYSNGLYHCKYQFSRDFISSDSKTTYFHHAIETVSVNTDSDVMAATVTISSPLQIISDTITDHMPTSVYLKKQQDGYDEAEKIIQDQVDYDKAHPCLLWRTEGYVTSCVTRQGDLN